jgi:crotonobetainyl-CoA hydratase
VLVITIDRPKANAIDARTSQALFGAFTELNESPNLRAGVITAGGDRFFCAGWDLKAAADGESHDADHGPGGFAGLTEFAELRKPVVAAVNGSAYGGGVELMLAAHLVVASASARFAFREARLGILPDAGGLNRLPARIPRAIALDLLLTGREISAEEAHRWGLVNRVVDQADVLSTAVALAQELCRSAPLSVEATLQAVQAVQGMSDRQAFATLRDNVPLVSGIGRTDDAHEGIKAFAEGRPPRWTGQ